MRELQEFLLQDTTVLSSALIAAIVAGLVNYLFSSKKKPTCCARGHRLTGYAC
ncbi:hypothetical protein EV696_11775 [Permianibacter aggregans]|uniref:Uncharacterized protein n=1 Tax=Permianibacter aggregans TaxID=1510150 RepID=A0A4R6UHJ4_9GAMM|nr:hypothetical protein EV696_11775 [Permianibacter aggregans]